MPLADAIISSFTKFYTLPLLDGDRLLLLPITRIILNLFIYFSVTQLSVSNGLDRSNEPTLQRCFVENYEQTLDFACRPADR